MGEGGPGAGRVFAGNLGGGGGLKNVLSGPKFPPREGYRVPQEGAVV